VREFDSRMKIMLNVHLNLVTISAILTLFSVRQGLELVQGEWNILKMGHPKYIGQCKMVRFKTIYIESLDTATSIPLMTDGIINVSLI